MAEPSGLSAYTGDRLIIFTAFFVPLQVTCVALRFLARYLAKVQFGLDDALVLTALGLQICMAGISIGSVKQAGVGHHIPYLLASDPQKVERWGQYLVAISILYLVSVNLPKLAILELYRRLFPAKPIRMTVNVLIGFLIALSLATTLTAFGACRPFRANWMLNLPGSRCIDREAFFRWASIPNIVTDVVMLAIPIRVVYNLQTTRRLKAGLMVTFIVGSFGLVTSCIRFAQFFRHDSFKDGTWSAVDLITWTQVETGVYLISACFMTYRPLLERLGRKKIVTKMTRGLTSSNKQSSHGSSEHNSTIALRPRNDNDRGFSRLKDDPRIVVTTNIQAGERRENGHDAC